MIASISIEKDGQAFAQGIRDRALLLIGFAGAFRRSELIGLNIEDLKLVREGYVVILKKSKTDQEGEERQIAIPYGSNPETCPVRSLNDWLVCSGIQIGPLFRPINKHGHILFTRLTTRSVARIIKRNHYLKDKAEKYSGHSLRAGFVTTAAIRGVPEHAIMRKTGHKRLDTMKKYIRLVDLWKEDPTIRLGL